MLRRVLTVIALMLAASTVVFGQTNVEEARKELTLGERAYRMGRYAEAEQRFRHALELDPTQKNAPLFIARAVQQQYKPGVNTPENLAVGERAVVAFQEILSKDPANDDAYKAIAFIYGHMKNEEKLSELMLSRANDFSLSNDKRAEAFVMLASKKWNCSYDITEQKENKTTEQKPDKVHVQYKMPADPGDFIRARQCVTEGMQLVEQALTLAPKNPNPWSYKANLLREASKLAEMEGDAAQKEEYQKQFEEALQTQVGLTRGTVVTDITEGHVAPLAEGMAANGKTIVAGGVLNGKAISKPQPAYPPIAKAARASGTVTVQILVDEEGNVVSASAVSGHPLLQQAAVAAAREAKFSPTLLSGQPVKVSGVVTYNFVLE
jgi:TonB family protein